jgi:molybdopterin/thiamine biosynthesis adenylyltransferase
MKCYLHGLRGLGVEIAKNLILAGPSSLTLYDPTQVSMSDLGSNFYCKHGDVGVRSRAEASVAQLKELNPYVTVTVVA